MNRFWYKHPARFGDLSGYKLLDGAGATGDGYGNGSMNWYASGDGRGNGNQYGNVHNGDGCGDGSENAATSLAKLAQPTGYASLEAVAAMDAALIAGVEIYFFQECK